MFLLAGRAADAHTIAGGAPEGNQTNLRGVDLALAFPVRDSIALITSHLGYVDWLAIVTRDDIAALWPHVETVAHALLDRQTLTAAEVNALLARA